MRWASATPCGIAPATKPRHSTAPLGLPGSAITSDCSTTAARLRERIAFGVIFIDSARITSPKPGSSTPHQPADRLRRDVACREAGAAGGQNEAAALRGEGADRFLELRNFIRHDRFAEDAPVVLQRGLLQGRAAEVVVFAAAGAVGNGNNADGDLHSFVQQRGKKMRELLVILSRADGEGSRNCNLRPSGKVNALISAARSLSALRRIGMTSRRGPGFRLLQQSDVLDLHLLIDRFAHVVNREKRDGHPGECFHFDASLRRGPRGAGCLHRCVVTR